MTFIEPITVKDVIEAIHRKRYLLPAIQREFVWTNDQIERLFDSLLRNYPISSFLFWDIEKDNVSKYQFYEFIREYHEKNNKHSIKANLKGENGITAILDGQQRLTALYIGLKGSLAYKLPRKRWDNESSFPKRTLYLNLLASSEDEEREYDFQFLYKNEYELIDQNHHWFSVGDILDLKEEFEVNNYLTNKVFQSETITDETKRFASRTLFNLHKSIHKDKVINFYLEKDESLDKVLNIFIRVNSGGTKLSYSDLLLSIATAQWKEKDAREEITSCVDEINSIGDGFNVNKDFILKASLVLSDIKDIAFKVDNFNQQNMFQIEKKWEQISKSVKLAFTLLFNLGYCRDTLTSNNAVIPIAYYLQKIELPDSFCTSSKYSEERNKIFKWLIIVLLKQTFSNQPDNVLRPLRDVIKKTSESFPLDEMIAGQRGTQKTLTLDSDEIENLFHYNFEQPYTYSVLALIYPSLDFRNKFHKDHIYPKKYFSRKNLKDKGINDDDIEFYLNNYNTLANLQLLDGMVNQEKSEKEFAQWIREEYPDENDQNNYMQKHYIPNVSFALKNFREFIENRKQLMKEKIVELIS